MPIYEYECKSCHHQFDLIQKVNEEAVKQCPQCFKDTAIRLISAAGFQLKGSGWYATDFKNKAKVDPPKENTPQESATKSPDNKTVDTTTATSSKGDSE